MNLSVGGRAAPEPPATRLVEEGGILFMGIYSAFPTLSWSQGPGALSKVKDLLKLLPVASFGTPG